MHVLYSELLNSTKLRFYEVLYCNLLVIVLVKLYSSLESGGEVYCLMYLSS